MQTWTLLVIGGIVASYLGAQTGVDLLFGIGVVVAFAGVCAVALTLASDYDSRRG